MGFVHPLYLYQCIHRATFKMNYHFNIPWQCFLLLSQSVMPWNKHQKYNICSYFCQKTMVFIAWFLEEVSPFSSLSVWLFDLVIPQRHTDVPFQAQALRISADSNKYQWLPSAIKYKALWRYPSRIHWGYGLLFEGFVFFRSHYIFQY